MKCNPSKHLMSSVWEFVFKYMILVLSIQRATVKTKRVFNLMPFLHQYFVLNKNMWLNICHILCSICTECGLNAIFLRNWNVYQMYRFVGILGLDIIVNFYAAFTSPNNWFSFVTYVFIAFKFCVQQCECVHE